MSQKIVALLNLRHQKLQTLNVPYLKTLHSSKVHIFKHIFKSVFSRITHAAHCIFLFLSFFRNWKFLNSLVYNDWFSLIIYFLVSQFVFLSLCDTNSFNLFFHFRSYMLNNSLQYPILPVTLVPAVITAVQLFTINP